VGAWTSRDLDSGTCTALCSVGAVERYRTGAQEPGRLRPWTREPGPVWDWTGSPGPAADWHWPAEPGRRPSDCLCPTWACSRRRCRRPRPPTRPPTVSTPAISSGFSCSPLSDGLCLPSVQVSLPFVSAFWTLGAVGLPNPTLGVYHRTSRFAPTLYRHIQRLYTCYSREKSVRHRTLSIDVRTSAEPLCCVFRFPDSGAVGRGSSVSSL